MLGASRNLLGRRIEMFGLAEAIAAQQKDLGVFDEPVGDRGGDGRVMEDVSPVGESRICSNHCRALMTVPCRNDLVEEVRRLLIKHQVS